MPKTRFDEIISRIEYLYRTYSQQKRAPLQPYLFNFVKAKFPDYRYSADDPIVSEPLLEHVGALPMIATTLFPYVHDNEVNLGEALIMLAIHDIGELEVGDEITFSKDHAHTEKEVAAALRLLDPAYHAYYLDIEHQNTKTGKFAKSIDKIAPDFLDLFSPYDETVKRYKEQLPDKVKSPHDIYALKRDFKHRYMTWNPFLKQLHIVVLDRIKQKFV